MTPPDLPRDPAEYRRRPLMGVGFWAMIAFGILCVLAGAGVAYLAPRYLAPKPPAAPASAPPAAAAAPAPSAAMAAPAASADEVARLNARIAALENQGARSSEAAQAALAAAVLAEAAQGSRPFGAELAAMRAAEPQLPELAALSHLAEVGAPSHAVLAQTFPDYAARAARKARKPQPGAGMGAHLAYALTKIVIVRRIDETAGASPDAVLARAGRALDDGQVAAALKALDTLPPAARDALLPWRAGAERRAEIDRQLAALRLRARQDLAQQGPAA
ncbi:MAG: hypothetical protein JF588_09135 [Caulobacterales bacterium]|nr:hypothetical protein [Caulobacterales bacterium]